MVWLWETESGKLRSTFSTSNGSVQFSPNGERLLTRAYFPNGSQIQVCSVPDAKVLKVLYKGSVSNLLFSPDGKSVAVRSLEKFVDKVQLVDVATGASTGPERRLEPPGGNVSEMLFSPDGRRLLVTKDRLAPHFSQRGGRNRRRQLAFIVPLSRRENEEQERLASHVNRREVDQYWHTLPRLRFSSARVAGVRFARRSSGIPSWRQWRAGANTGSGRSMFARGSIPGRSDRQSP